MITITEMPATGVIIKADTIKQILSNLKETTNVCFCNCNYVQCDCNCNYCTCNCNYCTCNCNWGNCYHGNDYKKHQFLKR